MNRNRNAFLTWCHDGSVTYNYLNIMLCMDQLLLQAIAGKNFLRIPIDITYYYGVSVWIRIPINTMSRGHNPIRSDERSTANMASTDTERDLPWP